MTQVVLGVAGGVAGFFVGGPAGAAIGFSLGMALGAPEIPGPQLGEIAKQTAKEGDPRLIVWGIVRPVGPNLIAVQDPPVIHRVSQGGGKGGSGPRAEVPFRTYALGVCEGPITGYRRIWRNNKLVYDGRPGSAWGLYNNPVFMERATFYYGDYDQLPDPDLEAVFGVGEVPAHRGTAYIVIKNEDLQDTGGAVPQWLFEVVRDAGANRPSIESSELLVAHGSSPRVTRISVEDWSELTSPLEDSTGSAFGAEYSSNMKKIAVYLSDQPRFRVIDIDTLDILHAESMPSGSGEITRLNNGSIWALNGAVGERFRIINQLTYAYDEYFDEGTSGEDLDISQASGAIALAHVYQVQTGFVTSNASVYMPGGLLRTRIEQDPLTLGNNQGVSIAFSKDGLRIYIGQFGGGVSPQRSLRALSYPSLSPISVPPYESIVTSIDTHPNNRHIAIGLANGRVELISTKDDDGNPEFVVERSVTVESSSISAVRFSAGGKWLAYGVQGATGAIYIREVDTWDMVSAGALYEFGGSVNSIRWSPK